MTAWYRQAAASRSALYPQPHVGASLVGGRAAVHRHQRRVLRVKRAQLVTVDVCDATAVVHQVSHRLHCRRRLAGPGLAAHHDQLRRCAGRQTLEQQRPHQVDIDSVERRIVKQAHATS